jgi:hypothetical protein
MTHPPILRLAAIISLMSFCIYALWVLAFLLLPTINPDIPRYAYWRETLLIPTYTVVGFLITTRRPAHRIGWLFTLGALAGAIQTAAGQYAAISLTTRSVWLPGGDWAGWLSQLSQITTLSTILLLLLLFPTGRLLSRRWSPVAWSLIAGIAAVMPGMAFSVGELQDYPVPNPAGMPLLAGALEVTGTIGAALVAFGFFGSVAMLIMRTRQAQGVERQQIKWFVFTAVAAISLIFGFNYLLNILQNTLPGPLVDAMGSWIWTMGPVGLAIATALAILRYRLFDIDIIIRRTLVYGGLTATLALIYFGSILVLQGAFVALSGQRSTAAVVISTLVIAALFTPLRRRIQNDIDRRFFRRKYDAQKTVEAFSANLREELDLDELSDRLLATVEDTLEPAHASLWIRERKKS